jgi:hypothetical protein
MSASVPPRPAVGAMMHAAKHVTVLRTPSLRREPMKRHPLPDEPVQVVSLAATGGTFTLTYSGQETGALAFDVPAAGVQSALEALGRIGAGNVAISGPDGGPYEVRFGGELTGKNVAVVEPDGDGLEGTVEVTTQVPSPWE